MKLTNEDKKLLVGLGHKEEDLKQIEKATVKTMYELSKTSFNTENFEISANEAIEILGRRNYLNGISRSAFHRSACVDNGNGQVVHFDSSKLFKI